MRSSWSTAWLVAQPRGHWISQRPSIAWKYAKKAFRRSKPSSPRQPVLTARCNIISFRSDNPKPRDKVMRQIRRSFGILVCVLALSAGTAILTTHAADHAAPARKEVATPAATAAGPTGAIQPSRPGAPPVPEESASVRDDPTLVPDPKQSADNNVSFPNDI